MLVGSLVLRPSKGLLHTESDRCYGMERVWLVRQHLRMGGGGGGGGLSVVRAKLHMCSVMSVHQATLGEPIQEVQQHQLFAVCSTCTESDRRSGTERVWLGRLPKAGL